MIIMEEQTKSKIEERVVMLISQSTGKNSSEISMDLLIEDLSQDSIQLFEIVTLFEREFNSRVTYDDLMRIEKVGDIVEYAQKVLGAASK